MTRPARKTQSRIKIALFAVLTLAIAFCTSAARADISRFCQAIFNKPTIRLSDKLRYYNPLNLSRGKIVDAVRLLGEDFYTPEPDGAVVGISGYVGEAADLNRATGNFLTGKPFINEAEGIYSYDAASAADLFEKLMSVYRRSGPIKKLAIMGHGTPGDVEVGLDHLTVRWIRRNERLLARIPDDLFVKDAEIVLLSCSVAEGTAKDPDAGVRDLQKIFSSFVRNGAHIIASRQVVNGSLGGFRRTRAVRQAEKESDDILTAAGNAAVMAVAIPLIPMMIKHQYKTSRTVDEKSKFDPVEVIRIEPTVLQAEGLNEKRPPEGGLFSKLRFRWFRSSR